MKLSGKFAFQSACLVVSALVILVLLPVVSQAAVTDVGLRYGKGFRGTDFDQYDLSVSMDLPWQHEFPHDWLLRTNLEGIASILTWDGDTAFKPSLMGNLILTTPWKRLDFLAGLGLGVMIGDTEFHGDHDLGGPFFFQGQAGLRLHLTDRVFLGYRYYHQSNAQIYESNDSVNLNEVEIGWTF